MTMSLAFESVLEKCLANYLKEDVLECSDLYKCEKCKKLSKARIKTDISKLPTVLVFHIKRFQFPSMKKITTKVKFPPVLDLSM